MRYDLFFRRSVINISSHGSGKFCPVAIPAAGIAAVTAGHQIAFVVATTQRMWSEMVKGELYPILDPLCAVSACEPIAQVDRQSFYGTNPIHPLPLASAQLVSVFHLLQLCASACALQQKSQLFFSGKFRAYPTWVPSELYALTGEQIASNSTWPPPGVSMLTVLSITIPSGPY